MIDNIKKNIISIIIAAIVIPFVAGIYWNTRDVPGLKDQNSELKNELKELRKEFEAFQKDEWERYVDLNTRALGTSYKLRKELGK